MCYIKVYEADMYQKLIIFLTKCFPESGKELDINGRHAIYKDIAHNYDKFMCLMDGTEIIGTVAIRRLAEKDCELKSLYIYEKYYGKRFGYQLLCEAMKAAKEFDYQVMYLDSLEDSKRAISLYEKVGFQRTERYNQNERAKVFMKIDLT